MKSKSFYLAVLAVAVLSLGFAGCAGTNVRVAQPLGDGKAYVETDGTTFSAGYTGVLPDLRGLRK